MHNIFRLLIFPLLLLFFVVQNAIGQEIDELFFYPETIETLMEDPVTFVNDPVANGGTINVPANAETESNFELPATNVQFGVSAEAGFSPTSKYLNVPLSFRAKGFGVSISIPFYIQKKAKYPHGFVAAYGGLGDITASISYRFQTPKVFEMLSATSSFPTGNQNRTIDGYIVPMGTGSFDFIFSNSFQYRHSRFRLYNNLSYRLSGKCKREIAFVASYFENDTVLRSGTELINYVTANGNILSCNTTFDYPMFNFMSLHAGFSVINCSAGSIYHGHTYSWKDDLVEYPTEKANQEYTAIDVRAAIAFSYWGIDLMCVVAQPVYVLTENPLIKESLKFNFYVRLSKKIF